MMSCDVIVISCDIVSRVCKGVQCQHEQRTLLMKAGRSWNGMMLCYRSP